MKSKVYDFDLQAPIKYSYQKGLLLRNSVQCDQSLHTGLL